MAIVSSSYLSSFTFIIIIVTLLSIKLQVASSVLILNSRNKQQHRNNPMLQQANQSSSTSCDLYMGSWVHDNTYPMYQPSACPIIDARFNCLMYGRPDTNFLNYRWRPSNCELPRFNGVNFLSKMRGKSIMFVGDSLGRNQWESLICLILAAVPPSSKTQVARGDILSTFDFLDYEVRISYYKATYLVDIDAVQGKRVLKLDDIRGNANAWMGVDVLSFNTGHWWIHTGSLQMWDYMESGGTLYEDMDRLVALEIGMRTWARWVDANVDTTKTTLFFQGISPTHDKGEWSDGTTSTAKSCYGETSPMTETTYPAIYSDQMKVVEAVIRDMNNRPYLLDITLLSAMRKDAHPSIYGGDLTPDQRANPEHSADCSHWCLPGLPDTWNQLFYTALFF